MTWTGYCSVNPATMSPAGSRSNRSTISCTSPASTGSSRSRFRGTKMGWTSARWRVCSLPSISISVRPMTLPTSAFEREEYVSASFSTARQSSYFATEYATRPMNSMRITGVLARIIANKG